jgi:hypothetical protein
MNLSIKAIRQVANGLLPPMAIHSLLKMPRTIKGLQSLHMLVISMKMLCEQTKHY